MTFVWIPAKIEGNGKELTDKSAKEATKKNYTDMIV